MRYSLVSYILFQIIVCVCAQAVFAAPPTLQSPAAGASIDETTATTFEWSSDLQGSPDAKSQAYFVVEIISEAKMPEGQQVAWPNADTQRQTDAGVKANSIKLGVPAEGTWRWRVCAWGVVDPLVSTSVQQIPDGCSVSRSFTVKAAAVETVQSNTVIDAQTKVVVDAAPTIERRYVNSPTVSEEPTEPVKAQPISQPEYEAPVREQLTVEKRNDVGDKGQSLVGIKGAKSAVGLDNSIGATESLGQASASARDSFTGAMAGGLTATLPGIPIPFWVLALLLFSVPIAIGWRKDVLNMFEWEDGSIDGLGNYGVDAQVVELVADDAQVDTNSYDTPYAA